MTCESNGPGDTRQDALAAHTPPPSAPPWWAVALGLAAWTLVVFWPVTSHEFINFDDDVFVTENPRVMAGVTWEGVRWAFGSADIDYWRPLSWLSHMLDVELFGLRAGRHHLTSLLLHAGSAVILFLALRRLTGALWASALVAGLFAWHPLHVESVAWVAERKDVLCGLGWTFTLWAYARYVAQPAPGRYALVLLGFAFGAMAKPMIVTLPCVLLLLDYWPLGRVRLPARAGTNGQDWRGFLLQAGKLVGEKAPMLLAAVVLGWFAVSAQQQAGAMKELLSVPFELRAKNALAACGTYLWQMIWPADLCILYPLAEVPTWRWAGAGLVLGAVSLVALILARRQRFAIIGWLWFLGSLVPVIGLLQVGGQAHADRYTYLPLVGVWVMVVWGFREWAGGHASRQRAGWCLSLAALAACSFVARRQVTFWKDSTTVFNRAVEVAPASPTAWMNLGLALAARDGHARNALPCLARAVGLRPDQNALLNLAWCHVELNDYPNARVNCAKALALGPDSKYARRFLQALESDVARRPEVNGSRKLLAWGLAASGDLERALAQLSEALRRDPKDVAARLEQADYLQALRREGEVLAALEETVGVAPTNHHARLRLGEALTRSGRFAEAAAHFRVALELLPTAHDTRYNYAVVLNLAGRPRDAKTALEEILHAQPRHLPALQQLAWLLSTREEVRDGVRAISLASTVLNEAGQRTAIRLDVLAAAHAAAGEFATAASVAAEAITLARAQGRTTTEQLIRERQRLYQQGRPFTEPVHTGEVAQPPRG